MSEAIPLGETYLEEKIINLVAHEKRGDFEFHVERYRKMAEEYSKQPWIWRLWTSGVKKMTAADFAKEEHLRDVADLFRREHEEFIAWQNGLKPVIRNLLLKRDDPNGRGKKVRAVLLILGGGMRGSYSAGQVLGLNQIGMNKVFDVVAGISAGAGLVSYFSAGENQTRIGASIFYEECVTKDFINFLRIHKIMNIHLLGEVMRKGKKKLDEEAIKKSKTDLYCAVTREDTLEPELIDAKTADPDIAAVAEASMALPLLFREAVKVNGVPYIDGAFDFLPIKKVIKEFNPTDVLILPTTPFDRLEAFHLSFGEFLLVEMSSKLGSLGSMRVIEKLFRMKEEFRKSLEYIKDYEYDGINIGILWPPDSGLTNLTTNPHILKAATLESARDTIDQFGEKQPSRIESYETLASG